MSLLRTIYGKIFGRSAEERTTGPGPAGRLRNDSAAPGRTRLEDELESLRAEREARRKERKTGGNGKYTRKSRDRRPPAVRFGKETA